MSIYETSDGMGKWIGTYKVKRKGGWRGQWLWSPVKKWLLWWVRDRSRKEFWDWPDLFRVKEHYP